MRVSILSAVHNEAAYLSEMLDSVRCQSHQDWELVFVSDGSTDDTLDVLAAAASEDPRIVIAGDGAKIGKAAAFNAAFVASSGDVVVLLAGDDTLPVESLATRCAVFDDIDPRTDELVAFFKLRTMSKSPKHDAMILPRGSGSSHSGGTIMLTRALASRAFPIDPSLVSEDLWLCRSSEGLAEEIRESEEVVLNYRIHAGNSNPRNQDFKQMAKSMEARHRAWRLLLDCLRFEFSTEKRLELTRLANLESLRREGRTLAILRQSASPFGDRAAYAAMSSAALFGVRKKCFRLFSGRRSR